MSVFSYLGKQVPKLKVEVKSTLEEALEKMPDQAMTPDEVRNGLKNRGVQNIEIEQSATDVALANNDKVNPRELLQTVKTLRADKYSVYEYKGTPVRNNADSEDVRLFSQFLETEGEESPDTILNLNSLDRFIKRQNELRQAILDDADAEDFDLFRYQLNQTDTRLAEARAMRYRLLNIGTETSDLGSEGNRLLEAWADLTDEMGYAELDYLHKDNIDEYITKVREDLQDVDIEGYGDAESVALTRAAYEDRISQAEDIKRRLIALENEATLSPTNEYTRALKAEFEDILNEGVEDAEFTVNELDQFIDNRRNDIENLYRESDRWTPSELAERVADLESEIRQVEGIRRRLGYATRYESPTQILDEFEFEDYALDEVYTNLDDYVSEIHRQEGLERAVEFRERMQAARPMQESYDLTVPTQEIIDSTQNEFNSLAARHGLHAPDVNDTEETKQFLRIVVNMDDDPETIQRYMQSYDELAGIIERGDETVTIPNWNTRDMNSRYEFGREHYRDYSLPNTNDASYSVRIYKNPAVNTKGYNYGTHWSNPEAIEHAVFHVRSDVPQPGVYRIQEIQSDIQNEMTSDKIAAVQNWHRGTDVSFPSTGSILDDPQMSPQVEELIAGVNREYLDQIHRYTGLTDEFDDIMNVEQFPRTRDLAEQHELARYLVELVTNGRFNLDMPEGPAKGLLQSVIDGWDIRDAEHLATLRKTIREYNPDMTGQEVENTVQVFRTFHESYRDAVNDARDLAEFKMRQGLKLRVTPEERINRILKDSDEMTSEEAKFRENVLTDIETDFEEAHGLFVPFNIIDMSLPRLKKQIMIGHAIHKGYDTLDEFAEDIVDRVFKEYPAMNIGDIRERLIEMIVRGDALPESFPPGVTPDLPDTFALAEEVLTSFKKKVEEGVKELTPLEKFPNAKDYDLPIPFIKQGLQEEIIHAINNGHEEVWLTVDPPGVDKLMRGRRPQKNYETGGITNKQFRNMAKRFGAEIIEEDGYLKMKLPVKTLAAGGGIVSVSAYAETDNQDFIENARKAGATDEEILAYMQENPITEEEPSLFEEQALRAGATPEEIKRYQQEQFINSLDESEFYPHPGQKMYRDEVREFSDEFSQAVNTNKPYYEKLPHETIRELAIELEVDPTTPRGIDAIYEEAYYRANPNAREDVERYREEVLVGQVRSDMNDLIEVSDFDQPWNWMLTQFGFEKATHIYNTKKAEIQQRIVDMGQERGLDLVYGQGQEVGGKALEEDKWYLNVEGNYYDVTPGMLATMSNYLGETIGGTVGAAAGLKLAATVIPQARLAKFGIMTAGAMAGAVLGDQIDYAAAAVRQHEDYMWGVAKDKMMGAAQVAAVGEVLGAGAFGLLAAGWRGITRVYNMFMDGNVDGAYQMLIEVLDLTDDEARQLVRKWEALNNKSAPTLKEHKPWWDLRKYAADEEKEKAIAVLSSTRASGENIVNEATALNPSASAAVKNEIDRRAKSLERVIEAEVGPGGIKQLVLDIEEGLQKYIDETGAWYEVTKYRANDIAPQSYTWNMNEMALRDLADSIITDIFPQAQRERAYNILEKIDKLTSSRTFSDLIELRQTINELKSGRSLKRSTIEAYNEIMANIDDEIQKVASQSEEGLQWLADWTDAKASYSEMKSITESTLGKAFKREIVYDGTVKGAQQAARWLADFGTAEAGMYQRLLKQLPPDVQPKVETLIIERIVSQNMVGDPANKQAILFPKIARELSEYNFVWPEARAIQSVVNDFAEVYQNDVVLSYVAGGISKLDAAHYLTDDIVRRVHFATINKVWRQIMIAFGGKKGDAAALSKLASKLLEDPLNPSNVEEALKMARGNEELTLAIKNYSADAAAARQSGIGVTTKVKTYVDGKGVIHTQPGPGLKEADSIPIHRITNEEAALKISRAGDIQNLSPAEKARLINAGFIAVGLDDGTVIKLL